MFYYKYRPEITNLYNPDADLVITAVIHVYSNEEKTDFIMQLPFSGIPFKDVPNKTAEGLKEFLEQKIEEQLELWFDRLADIVLAKEMGLYQPMEPQIDFPAE